MGVTIRQKTKGRAWWVFVSYKGRRTSKRVGTRRNAEKVAEHIEAKIKLGQSFSTQQQEKQASVPTLEAYYQKLKETYLATAVRETTRMSYETSFSCHILPAFGQLRLDQITRSQVKAFVARLVAKRLSRATIRIIIAQLCALLNHALEDELIATNPATRMTKYYKQAPVVHDEIQPLTEDEVRLFFRTGLKYSPQHYPLFLCAIHTG